MTRPFIIFVLSALFCFPTFGQNHSEKLELRTIITEIEQQYNVTFSYADQNIIGVFVVPPPENLNFSETLRYLSEQTGLEFRQLNKRHIAISKNNSDILDICGIIIDWETGVQIGGATVQSKNQATISDESGKFSLINLRSSDSVQIRFLGYAPLELPAIKFSNNFCDTIYFRQKSIQLGEIIVSNFITKGININSDGSIIISPKTMGILPGLTDPDILQTVQALPGVQSINETVSDINVRGGTNDQNLVLWDGIKMYQSGHFFGLMSAFNPYLTNSVTLIKNGTTAALSDGVSSTIDIRADDRVNNDFSGGAGINLLFADFYLKFPIAKKVSAQLSGRRSISDIIQTPTYNQYFDRVFGNTDVTLSVDPVVDSLVETNESFLFHDFSAKLLYDPSPKDKLRFSFLKLYNTISYEESALKDTGLETKTSGLDQESSAYGFYYNRSWSKKFYTTLQLYYSEYNLEAVNFDVLNDQRLTQGNEVIDNGIKLDARFAVSNTVDIYTGYQFSEVGVSNLTEINNPAYRRFTKKVLNTNSVFAEGNYSSASNKTNLRIGLRANYFDKFNQLFIEPRLAFTHRFLNHFYFEILGEIKSQTTTQVIDYQTDFLGVENRRWVLSDEENIPVVKSKQISSGIKYRPGNLLLSLEGYYKQVDGITSSGQGFQNQFQYVRTTGSYHVTGMEFLINQRVGYFNTWISYAYAHNNYDFPLLNPPVFPNNLDIWHTLTFGSSYQINNLQVSGGINWRTGKPITLPSEVKDGIIVYQSPNSSRLEDYFRVDISAVYLFNLSKQVRGEFGFSVWNLFNNRNIINTYFQVDKNNNLETIEQYALGFTPNVMFRISF